MECDRIGSAIGIVAFVAVVEREPQRLVWAPGDIGVAVGIVEADDETLLLHFVELRVVEVGSAS